MEAGFDRPFSEGKALQLLGASLLAFQAEPSRPAPWGDRPQGPLGIRQDPSVGSVVSGTLCRSKRVSWVAILTPFPSGRWGGGGLEGLGEAEGSRLLWI